MYTLQSKGNNTKETIKSALLFICANLAWAWRSTKKTKLFTSYHQQKHSIRLLSFKNQFTHSKPRFK